MRVGTFVSVCLSVAATLGTVSVARAAGAPDITGDYRCVGDAGGGKQYRGTVKVSKLAECYQLKWEINGTRYTGIGLREGDTLAVSIRQDGNDKYTGVLVYRVGKDGTLNGRWSAFGFDGLTYTETLTLDNGGGNLGETVRQRLENLHRN
jgi:hypothetical protein